MEAIKQIENIIKTDSLFLTKKGKVLKIEILYYFGIYKVQGLKQELIVYNLIAKGGKDSVNYIVSDAGDFVFDLFKEPANKKVVIVEVHNHPQGDNKASTADMEGGEYMAKHISLGINTIDKELAKKYKGFQVEFRQAILTDDRKLTQYSQTYKIKQEKNYKIKLEKQHK